jgi:hypothetical protein
MVVDIPVTSRQVGRLSCSFTFASLDGEGVVRNDPLLAVCERGPLYTLLDAAYASIAEFLGEWASVGGLISVQSSSTSASTYAYWSLDGEGYPQLSVIDSGNNECALRVCLSYSASR